VATSFRKFLEGLRIIPKTTSTASEQGDLDVTSAAGKLNYHNGTTASPVVTEAHSATLTNKTIDGDNNTVQDLALTSLKTVLADANKVIRRDASGIVTSGNSLPNSSEIVTIDSSTALTNKTLTSPVLNTPTADTITGIAGGALTVQSASNQNLSLQAQGTGTVSLESLTIDANTVTGGAATLTIQGASNQAVTIQSQGSGNLSLQASGTGTVSVESVSFDTTTVTGTSALTLATTSNGNLSLSPNGTGSIVATSKVAFNIQTDSTTTGANATVSTVSKSYIELTNVSLTSLNGVTAGGDGQRLVLTNRTGATITINNETGATAANRILTGTGGAVTISNNASIELIYNTSNSRWMAVGSAGGNARVSTVSSNTVLTVINDIVLASASGGSITVTLATPTSGKIFTIKKTDSTSNLVTILPSASETIDGTSAKALTGQYDAIQLVSDGTNWFII
jgi:hypothetical protein